jgi:hypothetical protein
MWKKTLGSQTMSSLLHEHYSVILSMGGTTQANCRRQQGELHNKCPHGSYPQCPGSL